MTQVKIARESRTVEDRNSATIVDASDDVDGGRATIRQKDRTMEVVMSGGTACRREDDGSVEQNERRAAHRDKTSLDVGGWTGRIIKARAEEY